MEIRTFPSGRLETNCHLLISGQNALAVDVGENPEAMAAVLREQRLVLTHILLTHLHADHVCGVQALQQAGLGPQGQPPETWGSSADLYLQQHRQGRGGGGYPRVPPFDFSHLEPGKLRLLEHPLLVLDTPGHTPGGLSFYFPRAGVVFVGDLLFKGSVGRTDWEGGDADVLMRSIRERIFILPDETRIFPGHGPATTVGREKAANPFFAPSPNA